MKKVMPLLAIGFCLFWAFFCLDTSLNPNEYSLTLPRFDFFILGVFFCLFVAGALVLIQSARKKSKENKNQDTGDSS